MVNLAGYVKSSFDESKGNDFLDLVLTSTNKIYSHFSKLDKGPNFDGHFELLDNNGIPIGRFNVQIKTMSTDYKNNNKRGIISQYKYSCDTKIFNAVKYGITLDPCYLFMIDVVNRRIFGKYVSLEYVLSLDIKNEYNKVIYFNDDDEIVDVNNFYNNLVDIYNDRKNKMISIEQNKFIITSSISDEELSDLQLEFDYLNNMFDNELKYIKDKLFPNIWKFGIAYMKEEKSLGVGIYYIKKGKNGEFIKYLNDETFGNCSFITISNKTKIRDLINGFISSILERCYEYRIIPIEYVDNEVLFEILFYFLDEISKVYKEVENKNKLDVYYKDEEDINIIKNYYYGIEKYIKYTFGKAFNVVTTTKSKYSMYKIDPLDEPFSGNDMYEKEKLLINCFKELNDDMFDNKIIVDGNHFYELIKESIYELERRNIKKVKRVWIPKDWNDYINRVENGNRYKIENTFKISDYNYNIEKLLSIFPSQYNDFVSKINKKLLLKNKYVCGYSNDDKYLLRYEKYESNKFEIIIDNHILNNRVAEITQNMKNKKFISRTDVSIPYAFKDMTLLMNLNYVFIRQFCFINGIKDIDLNDQNILFDMIGD